MVQFCMSVISNLPVHPDWHVTGCQTAAKYTISVCRRFGRVGVVARASADRTWCLGPGAIVFNTVSRPRGYHQNQEGRQ